MSKKRMMQVLENARKASEVGCTIWAMSNGNQIRFTENADIKNSLKTAGYWVCSIFENGHMVDL